MHRKFYERVHIPAAPFEIDHQTAPVILPELRNRDKILRQYPRAQLPILKGTMPELS